MLLLGRYIRDDDGVIWGRHKVGFCLYTDEWSPTTSYDKLLAEGGEAPLYLL